MKRVCSILLGVLMLLLTACQRDYHSSSALEPPVSSVGGTESAFEPASSQAQSDILEGTSSLQSGVQITSSGTHTAQPPKPPVSSQPVSAPVSDSPSQPPDPRVVRVTVIEGWSFMQIAEELERKGVCSRKDFYQAAQNYTVKSFTIPSSPNRCFKLEGYLFPDTYEFYKNDNPINVIRKMLNNYAAKSGMPSDETLILASIIEREARSSKEMANVSSVFHNRLKAGMQLGADPTRDYVKNFITDNALVENAGKYAPLYNTYRCKALPAGPICSPSLRAIQAALYPSSTDYLYFFFGNDNQNHYSKTYEEHNQKMKEFGVQNG